MKKTIFMFLPLTLLFTLFFIVTVFAATTPSLEVYSSHNGKNKELILNDVPANCYGVEITLTTNGEDFDFENEEISNVYTTYHTNDSEITLYVVSKDTPLNKKTDITIGTLSSKDSFKIKSASQLKLLDEDLNKTEYESLTISEQTSSSNSSSSGSGSSSSSSSRSSYDVSIRNNIQNGSIRVSSRSARKGETITITVQAETGYIVDNITVTDNDDKEITVANKGNNEYTFVMPASNVIVNAKFKATSATIPTAPVVIPPTTENITLPFTDVKESDWFYSAVKYVYEHSMMAGTATNAFSPDMTTTRGMIVTILHRLDNTPVAAPSHFTDVAENQYYTNAVAWASANGIVSGYGNGNFGPNDIITREQMASILYRYAQYKGYDTDTQNNISNYSDATDVSSYALPAVQWANGVGILSGVTNTTLVPYGSATRAQVSSILMRFCENIVK